MDFATVVRTSARQYATNAAVWHDGEIQTYAQLYERGCRLANALGNLGLDKRDRVALLGANGPNTVEQIAGVALGGFIRAALYAHQTGEVNAYLLDHVGARALIIHEAHLQELVPHLAGVPSLEYVIVYGAVAHEGDYLDYERLLAGASAADPQIPQSPQDGHVIRFSAGTTGRPKGIYHTVEAWLGLCNEYRWVTPQIDERDSYLAAGPLTHAAVIFLWPMLMVGARIVVMEAFDPQRALQLIDEQRITFTLVVPTMIQAMVAHRDAATRDLSTLRCLNYAASPISETTLTKAVDVFGPVLYQLYAQSEAVPATMLLPHQHCPRGSERERRWMRSVGRATPNAKLTIVDDDGNPLPVGEVGEVAVKTPGQMTGLWDDPEGTARRLTRDGSVRTRDMGRLDDDGFLYLADRKEDMIISGGYNIWPAELENAIAAHPAVAEVCVVGVPHEKWGETPIAVVVPTPGEDAPDPDQLIELTRERVGSVMKVTRVEFVDELPKSGVGKVLRRVVRDRYWEGRSERVGGA
ncbi:MAG TPA: AMP-binding protein [Solirubrobacteraceae bacterium]|nr:AMP-binding protein [Solirubrobacteraceae bacterium]